LSFSASNVEEGNPFVMAMMGNITKITTWIFETKNEQQHIENFAIQMEDKSIKL